MYSGYEKYKDDTPTVPTSSGKRNREDDLSNFINAEVVRRAHHVSKAELLEEERAYITLDIDDVLEMKAKQRMNWLKKAIDACRQGTLKLDRVFDIFKHPDFGKIFSPADGRRALYTIKTVMDLMSWKQQKYVDSPQFELHRKHSVVTLDDSDEEQVIEILDAEDEAVQRLKKTERQMSKNAALLEELSKKKQRVVEPEESEDEATKPMVDDKGNKVYEELRLDPADGAYYTKQDFIDEYGEDDGRVRWNKAAPERREESGMAVAGNLRIVEKHEVVKDDLDGSPRKKRRS